MSLFPKSLRYAASIFLFVAAGSAHGQGGTIPVKPGLWESQVSVTSAVALPPEAEARIAALPPDQQAMVRSRMGGGAKPVTSTNRSCVAPNTTVDSLVDQQQKRPSGLKCTFTNRAITSGGGSFDTSCTGEGMTATAHTDITIADSEHVLSKTHMTATGSRNGMTSNMTTDSTESMRFVSADCGDVKPNMAGGAASK